MEDADSSRNEPKFPDFSQVPSPSDALPVLTVDCYLRYQEDDETPALAGALMESFLEMIGKALRFEGHPLLKLGMASPRSGWLIGAITTRGPESDIERVTVAGRQGHPLGSMVTVRISVGDQVSDDPVSTLRISPKMLHRANQTASRRMTVSQLAREYQRLALRAILTEALITPKPGLVDMETTGSHRDMDIFTLIDSAAEIHDLFSLCARRGYLHRGPLPQLFESLREAGLQTEKRMFQATRGVNTHRGLIFSLGIAVTAAAYIAGIGLPAHRVFFSRAVQRMTSGLTERELNLERPRTNGQRAYANHGVSGARGEAEQGFPSVVKHALPALDWARKKRINRQNAALFALLTLVAIVEDSVLIHRGGMSGLVFAQRRAGEIRNKFIARNHIDRSMLKTLDQEFIRKNLSPGGSADLLAVALFWHDLENRHE